jgi:16S rRNA processing protein RimM
LTSSQLITIAKIVKAQGNRGEVAAEILTDFPDRFEHLTETILQKGVEPALSLTLESFWFHKKRVILKFRGIESISAAEALRSYEIKILRDALVPLEQGVYYQHDLVDCMIKDKHGNEYGKVAEVLDTGGHYLLKIDREKGEFLIPFAESMLVRIDLDKKEMIFDLPEGLEDL